MPDLKLEDGTVIPAEHVCSIDESELDGPNYEKMLTVEHVKAEKIGKIFGDIYDSVPHAVIDSRETLTLGLWPIIVKRNMEKILSFLAYACEHQSRRKRVPVDVQEMVGKWTPLVKQLALAHDVDEKDLASSTLDDLLKEVITAPVKQIREFYRELTAALKKDKTVPWALWKLFDFWGENVLDKLETEQEMTLRGELAQQIAERSIEKIPVKDWVDSMIGSLMWRSPEKLEQIKASLDQGHQPRVRGKESCLFLAVGEAEVML